nr:MAG TPA: hypothetical protein [Caudoviricetes sp.]
MADEITEIEKAMETAVASVNSKRPTRRVPVKNQNSPTATISVSTNSTQPKCVDDDVSKLKAFVDGAGLAIKKADGKTYLLAEAWQYIMVLKNLTARCEYEDSRDEKGVLTVTVECDITDENDNVVSDGVMQARSDEQWLSDKSEFAVYGMAQTRAISRALRNRYGYLARACGFQATPLEEIS